MYIIFILRRLLKCVLQEFEKFSPKISIKFEELGKPIIGTQFSSYCTLFVHPKSIRSL